MEEPEWTPPLDKFRVALRKAVRSGIAIECESKPLASFGLGASRIGGHPDLPASCAWPTATRSKAGAQIGLPLAFLAQIALNEIASFTDELPKEGLLSFFMLDQLRLYDAVGWSKESSLAPDRLRVIFTPAGTKLERKLPENLPVSHWIEATRPHFRAVETWPPVESTVIGDDGKKPPKGGIALSKAAWKAWAEIAPKSPPAQLLGHPCGCEFPIGSDPDARLLLSLDAQTCPVPWELCGRNGHIFIGIPGTALSRKIWEQAFHKEW